MPIAIPRLVYPYVITAGSNDSVVFYADPTAVGGGAFVYTGTVAAATYVTPETLLTAIDTAIEAATRSGPVAFSTDGGSVLNTLSSNGRVTFTFSGVESSPAPELRWGTSAATQALGTLLGMGTSTLTQSSGIFTATAQIQQLWTPGIAVRGDNTKALRAGWTQLRTAGGQNKHTQWHSLTERTVSFEWLAPAVVFTADETTTNTAFERFWSHATARSKFRYSADRDDPTTGATDYFLLDEEPSRLFDPPRHSESLRLYSLELRMGLYTS